MNGIVFFIVLIGSGLTWLMDSSIRKQAKTAEKWIAASLLLIGVTFLILKRFNVSIVMPTDLLIQWISPWMEQYLTRGRV